MGSAKNKKRKRYFMCFQPIAAGDGSVGPGGSDGARDLVFTYVSVGGKEKMVIPKILTSLSPEKMEISPDGGDAGNECRRKDRACRCFTRALKSLSFRASSKARKSREDSFASERLQESPKPNKASNSTEDEPTQREPIDPNRLSSPENCVASTSASISLCPPRAAPVCRKGSFRVDALETRELDRMISKTKVGARRSSNVGLCLLVVCLLVLAFCGMICAIFITSTLLYLVPRHIEKVDSPEYSVNSPEIDLEEQKKRVVMEGLLQRGRSRVLLSTATRNQVDHGFISAPRLARPA